MLHDLASIFVSKVTTECWTCIIFDNLFAIISNCAGKIYQQMSSIAVITFIILLSFYILNAVWQNIKHGGSDPLFQDTVKPVLVKSLIALTLLTAGLMIPRLISTIILEPTAEITYQFAKVIVQGGETAQHYTSTSNLETYSFFTVNLRDTILKILETSVSKFQVYINFGLNVMERAFSISDFLDLEALNPIHGMAIFIRHIVLLIVGGILTYNFGKLFIKYSFCFMDIIVAMAMFAFFFPLSIVFFIFKDAKEAPGWMKKLGGDLGSGQIKKLVNAIISVAAAILTYTIIIAIINGFLNQNGYNSGLFDTEDTSVFFNFDLDHPGEMEITISGVIVLVYVLNYIADQIPQVTAKILEAFGVSQENAISESVGKDALNLTKLAKDNVKNLAKAVINPEGATKSN